MVLQHRVLYKIRENISTIYTILCDTQMHSEGFNPIQMSCVALQWEMPVQNLNFEDHIGNIYIYIYIYIIYLGNIIYIYIYIYI